MHLWPWISSRRDVDAVKERHGCSTMGRRRQFHAEKLSGRILEDWVKGERVILPDTPSSPPWSFLPALRQNRDFSSRDGRGGDIPAAGWSIDDEALAIRHRPRDTSWLELLLLGWCLFCSDASSGTRADFFCQPSHPLHILVSPSCPCTEPSIK
jgi:hypothetical protein